MPMPRKIVVVTGAGAGVGRAAVEEFASAGYDVALLSREPERLERAAAQLRAAWNVRALTVPVDVADAVAVEAAAERIERELGEIDVWVNVAMATVFAPVSALSARDFERATQVTYLGQVHGTMAALARMRERNRGAIVNVGSALASRAVPLQSAYCGAKFAVRGFTDALRSELIHDGLKIRLSLVDLPAMNTPQFDWAANRMGRRARPVAPVYQPEVAARAIRFAAEHRRRTLWLGWSTMRAIVGDMLAPGLIDRYLAHAGYRGQLTDEPRLPDAPDDLYAPVAGDFGAHGRFDDEARDGYVPLFTERHVHAAMGGAVLGLVGLAMAFVHLRRQARAHRR
ncbi:SDR family NAD(P)-dependent oxidoreductase [Paraburkholderia guartelaensis]|uniref:SDR family NAD(P)-dependent oxidoreductase n=1 Tax=Paraburkholderia guartelaensis TaxID=2546446 RepID=A0A4R5L6Z1_9BURK|nr:SDR family oxidoreductase [Paraburkholderia guartelaensis]TDG03444.1 SDR family NAD(P)-dependent oxidoreductase [Paraburkholderia guartelaensis]